MALMGHGKIFHFYKFSFIHPTTKDKKTLVKYETISKKITKTFFLFW